MSKVHNRICYVPWRITSTLWVQTKIVDILDWYWVRIHFILSKHERPVTYDNTASINQNPIEHKIFQAVNPSFYHLWRGNGSIGLATYSNIIPITKHIGIKYHLFGSNIVLYNGGVYTEDWHIREEFIIFTKRIPTDTHRNIWKIMAWLWWFLLLLVKGQLKYEVFGQVGWGWLKFD